MDKVNYRQLARQSLERARALLEGGDPDSLRYAALELRLCMEALTYDRAQAYKKEIPPEEWGKWQPRQLMKLLLEIDPDVDRSYSLSVGEEPHPGAKPEKMHAMGTETVFGLADLKKSYDAIGSMLHMPTMQQVEQGEGPNIEKIRVRCQSAFEDLTIALASPIWNFTVGNFASCQCANCGEMVRRRIPRRQVAQLRAKCFHCEANYNVHSRDDGSIIFEPRMRSVDCPTEGCDTRLELWEHEIKVGAHWRCRTCAMLFQIALGVVAMEDNDDVDSARQAGASPPSTP